jgi:predicted small metal-binding protein
MVRSGGSGRQRGKRQRSKGFASFVGGFPIEYDGSIVGLSASAVEMVNRKHTMSEGETAMKKLRCRDAGFDCDAVVEGATTEEVLAQAGPHAKEVHDVDVTPELAEALAERSGTSDRPA